MKPLGRACPDWLSGQERMRDARRILKGEKMSDRMQVSLGPCCACGGTEGVRTIVALKQKAPVPGRGWGCVVCDLPADGAVAVVCDACMEAKVEIKWACAGYPAEGKRVAVAELSGVHEHDLAKHRYYEQKAALNRAGYGRLAQALGELHEAGQAAEREAEERRVRN